MTGYILIVEKEWFGGNFGRRGAGIEDSGALKRVSFNKTGRQGESYAVFVCLARKI